jgi:hypothetical protein
MAFLASLWFSGLFRIEGMGGMTSIAFVLDVMAPFAECLPFWNWSYFSEWHWAQT